MVGSTIRNLRLPVSIDVVICTYNRAADLDRVLRALIAQKGTDEVRWSVLVVDNASTDQTSRVIAEWREKNVLPGFRSVLEHRPGLSHARARGFRETAADWIAFVDDDNLLACDWLAELATAIIQRPDAGGIGGRVILDWAGRHRSYLSKLGWCYAEQDHGTEMLQVENLVGAGMVLRREAMLASGWPDRILLEDRVGTRLVSGGDVEMVQRVKVAGYGLWYAPGCVLKHRIAADRMSRKHVIKLAFGLGLGAARVSAVFSTSTGATWTLDAWRESRKHFRYAAYLARKALFQREDLTVAAGHAAFAAGFSRGVRFLRRAKRRKQHSLIGAALRNNKGDCTTVDGLNQTPPRSSES